MPICASKGKELSRIKYYLFVSLEASCDETGMLDIPYGEGRAMMGGAVYKYRCNHGVEMEGSNTLVCDGERWNGTVPHCNGKCLHRLH